MKNINFLIIVHLLIAICCGCSDRTAQKDNSKSSSSVSEQVKPSKNLTSENEWVDYINLKSDSLQSLYTKESYKILEDEKVLEGNKEIANYYLSSDLKISSFHSDTIIVANKKKGLEYEIGEYVDAKNQSYKQLIIWKAKGTNRKRVFEFATKMQPSDEELSAIDDRRNHWMKLCNAHNAKILIEELYSKNTLYFNHKPLVIGKELLEKEYQYMNKATYQLSLNPIIVEMVNSQFVFEIGQCKGNYNGKYILIWRKDENGQWNIFIDSNI